MKILRKIQVWAHDKIFGCYFYRECTFCGRLITHTSSGLYRAAVDLDWCSKCKDRVEEDWPKLKAFVDSIPKVPPELKIKLVVKPDDEKTDN